jgi:hypothetical protein
MAQPTTIVGAEDIRPGYNGTGSTIGKYLAVQKAATTPDAISLAAAGARIYGITMNDVLDTGRGDVQIAGQAIATAGAAVIVDAALMATGTAGKLITCTGGNQVVAYARSAAGADGDLFEVELAKFSAGAL